MSLDIEQQGREEARWRILRALDAGRPYPLSEQIIVRVLDDLELPFTISDVRRELAYLRERKLAEIEGEGGETWYGRLTSAGLDMVEYRVAVHPGIARPKR